MIMFSEMLIKTSRNIADAAYFAAADVMAPPAAAIVDRVGSRDSENACSSEMVLRPRLKKDVISESETDAIASTAAIVTYSALRLKAETAAEHKSVISSISAQFFAADRTISPVCSFTNAHSFAMPEL